MSRGGGAVYGCKCVLPPADRCKNSFSTVIVVNNDAANIQVKVIIIQRSDFTRDSTGSFLKNLYCNIIQVSTSFLSETTGNSMNITH